MAGFSTYLANSIINSSLKGQAFTIPSGTYFALFTSDPTDSFTAGTEVTASWYARQATGTWASPTNGVTYNMAAASFPPVTTASVTITHVGIVDALTGGNLLYSAPLSTSKTLNVNDVYVIDSAVTSGDFTISIL